MGDNIIFNDNDEAIGYYSDLVKFYKKTIKDDIDANRYDEAKQAIDELQEIDEWTDAVLDSVDLVLLDVKHSDPDRYRALTGGSLATTLAFLDRVRTKGIPFWIRHVVVEGWTDNEEEILATVRLGKGAQRIELNGYHGYGEAKWTKCGVAYPLAGMKDFDPTRLDALRAFADNALLSVNQE